MRMILIAAAALAATTGSAQAGPRGAAPAAAVAYADLDLDDPGEAQEMLQRIRRTAAEVCRASAGGREDTPASRERYGRCHMNAVREAVRRLDAPAVRAAYRNPGAATEQLARLR
jgi:UrcA family protein